MPSPSPRKEQAPANPPVCRYPSQRRRWPKLPAQAFFRCTPTVDETTISALKLARGAPLECFCQDDVSVGSDSVASEPQALLKVLGNPAYRFKRIGLKAGPLSQWLFCGLAEAELPVICVETRHMQAVLKAQINKTDRNDACGIAQMMRLGVYRPVHVKTLRSQKLRMLLTHRKPLQSKAIAIENDLRGTLRNSGLKVGMVGTVRFEARTQELVETIPDLVVLVEPLLVVRRALREQIIMLHRHLLAIVRDDEVCRRLMTTPGVGPVVALTYRYRRCASPIPKIQVGWGGVWADLLQVSIRRDRLERQDIPLQGGWSESA
jgi:Transposase